MNAIARLFQPHTGATLTDAESLQLALDGIHSHAQQDDRRHRAEIAADVQHRWPRVVAWLDEEYNRRNRLACTSLITRAPMGLATRGAA